MLKVLVPFVIGFTVAACSGSPTTPTAVTPPAAPSSTGAAQPVAPAGMTLRGFVMDTAFRSVPGTRVEVMDGPSMGSFAVADAGGEFSLTGLFTESTQFRATQDGYESRTQPWNCSVAACPGTSGARPWLGFYLSVPAPSVNIAGRHTLTFVADTSCTALPVELRARSYPVTLTARVAADRATTPAFDVDMTGVPVVGNMTGFPIGVAGQRLNFWLHGGHDPAIVESLGANAYLAFSGIAATTVDSGQASTITAAFEGWIEHVVLAAPLAGPWYWPQSAATAKATCESQNHRLTLTRVN